MRMKDQCEGNQNKGNQTTQRNFMENERENDNSFKA